MVPGVALEGHWCLKLSTDIDTRAHTHIHTYTHAYTHTHIHTHTYTHIHACTHTYIHTCTQGTSNERHNYTQINNTNQSPQVHVKRAYASILAHHTNTSIQKKIINKKSNQDKKQPGQKATRTKSNQDRKQPGQKAIRTKSNQDKKQSGR